MKLQTRFATFALIASAIIDKVWSLDQTSEARSLFTVPYPGFNCIITAEIDCTVVSDNSDCKDLNIRKDQCGMIDVMIHYKYCNGQDDPILLRDELTQASFYDDFSLTMNKATMQAMECKNMYKQRKIDTCKRNWIVASLKVEGWKKFRENQDNYCFVYTHYLPPIKKYDAPAGPTSQPSAMPPFTGNPVISSEILCYLETFIGTGVYTIPCQDLNLEYFQKSLNSSGAIEIPDYKRKMKILFVVQNLSEENIDIIRAQISMDNTNDTFNIVDPSDNVVLEAEEPLVLPQVFDVDFAGFAGETIDIGTNMLLRGQLSKIEVEETDQLSVSVP